VYVVSYRDQAPAHFKDSLRLYRDPAVEAERGLHHRAGVLLVLALEKILELANEFAREVALYLGV
jgi:hypothetical protein